MKLKIIPDSYPSLSDFINTDCEQCGKGCEAPSIEMFCCVMKKLNFKEMKRDEQRNDITISG